MKKILALVVSVTLLLSAQTALAHSGRTDANGGHNCSEKSKQKGLCSGYHYHNSGTTTNSSSKSKSTTIKSSTSTNKSSSSKSNAGSPKKGYTTVDITLIVNGNVVPLDQKAVIVSGTVLIPLKNMFDALGATMQWDQNTKKITATKGDTTVELTVDSTTAKKKDETLTLKVKPIIINGYTMVPARFAAESFDASVEWDSPSSTITITAP